MADGGAQADCPVHCEKRFDRLTKVAAYLREHCRCRHATNYLFVKPVSCAECLM